MVGRRADGYHELRTVFQTVDLHDLIEVEVEGRGVALEVPEGGAPSGAANLAYRAAQQFLARWAPERGVRLTLRKRIPSGGGLGGGSSNAAAVLRALGELLEVQPGADELWELARGLGADVPYFLVGGTALGVGRGDEVVPLPELPEQEIWLVIPPLSLSTSEIFAAAGPPRTQELDAALQPLLLGAAPQAVADLPAVNDLEAVARARVPQLEAVYNGLTRAGATCARLSGSGATVFACFADSKVGETLAAYLPAGTRVVRAWTLNRSSLRAQFSFRGGAGG